MTCFARGQPGIQSIWSSKNIDYNKFTLIGNSVSKKHSDFVYDFESTIDILPNIYKYFFKKNNATFCQVVLNNVFKLSVECAMNFKCSVYYEKGYEISNTTTLTITGLNGKKYYSLIVVFILIIVQTCYF